MNSRLIVTPVLLLLVVLFAVQNSETVEVAFLLWGLSLPRSILILLVLAIGIVVGLFLRGAARPIGK